MKKIFGIITSLLIFLTGCINGSAVDVYFNNSKIEFDEPPCMISDRTMVPMRRVFEALGAEITWDGQNGTVSAAKGNTNIKVAIGSNILYKNGEKIIIDSPPLIKNDRTLVPLRAIAQCFGAIVSWNEDLQSASIAYADGNDVLAHFIDVGQGDSEFIELPNGKSMLIDAGTAESGDDVCNYIRERGYSDIDYLIATHPHADHIGGMTDVFESFNVKSVYMPNATANTKTFELFLDAIENEGCSVTQAKAGVNILSDNMLSADILSPVLESYDNLNDYSAVIRLTYGNTHYLFMGDCESYAEQYLINDELSSNVLKVGHHGSDSSSSVGFIERVHPEYAVISCGKNNSYGHPHSRTIDTLNAVNANILRTDEQGTLVLISDGDKITVNNNITGSGGIEKNSVYYASSDGNSNISSSNGYEKEQTSEKIVYKTKTGKKYHCAGCKYLKSCIEVTLKDALSEGLEPCSVCKP